MSYVYVALSSFWCLYCYFWTCLTPCSSVSIVNFEQVNAGREGYFIATYSSIYFATNQFIDHFFISFCWQRILKQLTFVFGLVYTIFAIWQSLFCINFKTLRKKCPYSELFWSAFSSIRTGYGVRIRSPNEEKVDQNNSKYGHLRSEKFCNYLVICCFVLKCSFFLLRLYTSFMKNCSR